MKNEKIKNEIEELNYKILNPGGNKTALVYGNEYTNFQKNLINKFIMEKSSQVEQVGFLSNTTNHLEMAGGEFCINATRCAIWEYLRGKKGEIELTVSGTTKKIIGKILEDKKVQIELKIEKTIKDLFEIRNNFTCIKIEGILIAILDEENSKKYIQKLRKNEEKAKNELKQIMITELNTEEKAIGIMLLENNFGKQKINPIVWVKEIDTIFYETSCGSGSLGTAIYSYIKNKSKKIELLQPSNFSIEIEIIGNEKFIEKSIITGFVNEENNN